jgi:membrane-associated PAP2 superfamily phosphatase
MNQAGLLIALAIAVVAGLVFGLYPQLDLALVSPFYDPATGWAVSGRGWVLVRNTASWLIALIAAPAAIALLGKIVRPQKTTLLPPRHALLMLLTLALGPGLLANVILKDNWGRPRPIEVTEFGGPEKFLPWWDPRGPCPKNCSFIAGEPSGAFWTLAPAALTPPHWRALAYGAALAFGAAIGLVRAGGGGHFISDVVFAGVFMFLLIWVMHGLLLRWRKDGLQKDSSQTVK